MIFFKIINKFDYKKYVKAEKEDSKIQLLLEIANMYRTLSAMFLMLTIFVLVIRFLPVNIMTSCCCLLLVYFVLFILFAVAFRKQYKYILERINVGN